MKTYYSNINKKKLCNRNNGELKTLPRFDFQMQDYFSVTFIDSLNKIIDIDPTDQFYIAGGLDVMKDSENLLFYSEDFTLENNKLTFTIDTYTDNYLKHIKNTNTPIYLEIGILNEKKTILLQDTVLAEPRVYLDGVAPTNIEVYYTKAQIDEKLAAVKVEQTDPVYTADKPNLALKSELPTKLSDLQNDEGYIKSFTQTDPVYTADKPNLALKSELPTKLSDLQNDEGYIKSFTQTDPIYTADKANIALKSELPTKLSQLQNDESYIKTYTQTDPVYTADKANIALKSQLPTKLSQLQNDEGYIKDYTQTDPVYTADKANIALKSELPTKLSDLQNDEDYIKSINGLPPDENGNVSLESGNKVIEDVYFGQSTIQTDNLNTLADIYWCHGSIYGASTGDFSFPTFSFNEEITSERQVKTIQLWVHCGPDIEVIYVPSDWTIIDEDNFPTNLTTGTTSVFVVRIYIDFNGNTHTIINYAYSFDEQ